MLSTVGDAHPFRVFLKHLYMSATENQLRNELASLNVDEGLIQVHLVKRGKFDGQKTINCFLTYSTKAQQDRAVDVLQGQSLGGLAKYPAEADHAYPRTTARYFDATTGVGPGPAAPVQAPAAAPMQPCPTVAPMQPCSTVAPMQPCPTVARMQPCPTVARTQPCPTAAPAHPCQTQLLRMQPIQPRPANTPPVTLRPAMFTFPPIPPPHLRDGPAAFQMPAAFVKVEGATAKAAGQQQHSAPPAAGQQQHSAPPESKAPNTAAPTDPYHPGPGPYHGHPAEAKAEPTGELEAKPDPADEALSVWEYGTQLSAAISKGEWDSDDLAFLLPVVEPALGSEEPEYDLPEEKPEIEEYVGSSAAFGGSSTVETAAQTSPTSPASEGHIEAAKSTKAELSKLRNKREKRVPSSSSSQSSYQSTYDSGSSRSRSRRRRKKSGRNHRSKKHRRGRKTHHRSKHHR